MTDQAEEWEAITRKVQSNSDHLNQIDQNIKNLKDISDLLDVNVEQLTSDGQSTEVNLEVVAKILDYRRNRKTTTSNSTKSCSYSATRQTYRSKL